ncbi:unnamed protein product [Schistocephalus solidus]|uniref:Rho-GAP domain-containing protein n=1 Tax=Schistocephalus solidus TaxID=70667 RepID=A0A183SCP7_SCHSO|nr:unnamed protein product [Schistocephalus solidus]
MTLDFLFSHLRRVVAYEPANQVSYECISICFGPVLFSTSTHMTQMNKVRLLPTTVLSLCYALYAVCKRFFNGALSSYGLEHHVW